MKMSLIIIFRIKKINFECKLEKCILNEEMGVVGNLNKHLKRHSISNEWYKLYLKSSKTICNKLSDTKLNFIKFIITSNLALKQLENVYLRKG